MIGRRKTSIRDVAAAAGVSVTTVSDALAGKGRLPEETRRKVRSAADKLNYRPSAIAQGLRASGLGLVGICIAPSGEAALTGVAYWATIVTHASQTFLSEGLAPVLLPHNVGMLEKLKIPLDGAIVVDPLESDPVLSFLEKKGVRYITIGRDLGRDQQSWLDDDNEKGIFLLLEQTVAPGTQVAFFTVGPRKSYVEDALAGATQWARARRSRIDVSHIENLESRNVEAAVVLALEQGAKALLAQHDRLAIGILAVLRARGINLPVDVKLLSGSDSPELERALVPVSALCQHPDQLAKLTASALIEFIRGKPERKKTLLPMDIVIRHPALAPATPFRAPRNGSGRHAK